MSRRLNLYGFSLGQMRRLFRSRDEQAVRRIHDRLATEQRHWRPEEVQQVSEIVERAISIGVPFAGLEAETYLHASAAGALAGDEQERLVTDASVYHATALEDGLWRQYGRYARPEVKAFLRGLVEGVPLFGQRAPEDEPYAAISLEKLRSFRAGLEDFREQVIYRIGRKNDPTEEDRAASEFVPEFCGWIDQIREAGRDLWYVTG
jgi:hypothetical protein